MNPQYITNTAPPPAQSVLQYSVSPDTVFISTDQQTMYASLTVTVFNPSQTETVTCMAFQFGFLVGAEYGDLTASAIGIQPSSDQTEWSISKTATEAPDNPNQYNYTVTPSAGGVHSLALAPEQSLYFHLNDIEINKAEASDSSGGEGVVPIFIMEMTGADPNNPQIVWGQVAISKETGSLGITSFGLAQPGPFDPGAAVTLSWTLMGADHWQLYDYDSDKLLYDSEKSSPPNETSYKDYPLRNTTYELVAFAGELFVVQTAQVMVKAARFVGEPYADPSEVEYNQTSMLNWQTQYASKLVITAAGFETVVLTAPPGQYDLFLQAPNNQLAVPPNTYTLTISGPGNSQDLRQVTVLLAFPSPVINTFTATTQVVGPGGTIDLSWGTSYGTIALLTQSMPGSGLQLPQIVATNSSEYKGSVYTVQPKGISTYTLLLRGQDNQQISSNQITAIGNAGTYPAAKQPVALASDGTYVWVTCGYMTVAALQRSDGTQPAKAFSIRAVDLAFDGTNIWALAMNQDFDGYVTTLRIDGNTIQAGPTSYQVDDSPSVMTYDYVNKCLWVICGNDGTSVFKLRLSDGKILGQFPAGEVAFDVIFDGTHVWVTDRPEGNLYVLNASDGSPAGEPFQQNPIPVGEGAAVLGYDGTYIWVANNLSNTLSVLRAADGSQVVKPFPVGVNPTVLCFDGTNIWLANSGDSHNNYSGGGLTVMRMNNGAVEVMVPHFTVGKGPMGLTFDGTDMWVSNYADGTVTKL